MSDRNGSDGKNERSQSSEKCEADCCACGPFCFEVTPGAKGVTIRIEASDPARAEALKTLICCSSGECAAPPMRGCCDGRAADGSGAGEGAPGGKA
jgi:hypothetical protein